MLRKVEEGINETLKQAGVTPVTPEEFAGRPFADDFKPKPQFRPIGWVPPRIETIKEYNPATNSNTYTRVEVRKIE